MNYNNFIELLAPVGSPEVLDAAIDEGADAVYLGLQGFNARLRAKNFSYKQFEAAVDKIHSLKKRIYVAINTVFEEWEANKIYNILKYINNVAPDAVIVQDFGIIKLIKDFFPDIKIHASTQMNVSSSKGVNFLSKYGVSRVVLGRELNFQEIKNIRYNTSAELELFVHGALCISVSGLCLFSSFLGGKSANRGTCTQPCRRLYNSDKHSGYFFSPNDLMLIEHVPELIDIGINSIKIEGRMRSAEYVATVVKAYRYVIDNYSKKREEAIKEGVLILKNDFARDKTKYFFVNKNNKDFLNPNQTSGTGLYLGKIIKISTIDNLRMGFLKTKYTLSINDTIRIHSADDKNRKSLKIKNVLTNKNGIFISISDEFQVGDSVYLINIRELRKSYSHIIPKKLDKYKKHPGNTKIPEILKNPVNKNVYKRFPQGLYVKINRFKDIYITQSIRAVKVIIDITKENSIEIKKSFSLISYKPDDIILYLNPYFQYKDELWLKNEIEYYIENGFKNFILNNIGHFSLFQKESVNLICGPYLYTFNKYSIDFLLKLGCNFFISPIENNKRNLISSTENFNRNSWFTTIFAYPELFQIQTELSSKYNFGFFADKMNNMFNLISSNDSSIVVPERPFSIIDKISY